VLVAGSGKETSKRITEGKSAELNGPVTDAEMGHAVEFPPQMSLYQHCSGFPSCVNVAKSGFVWQLL